MSGLDTMAFDERKRKLQNRVLGQAMDKLKKKKGLRILCLPGEAAWDLGFFGRFKNVTEIVGVEREKSIAEGLARGRHKKTTIVHSTTTDYIAEADEPFDIVYLDYMGTLSFTVTLDIALLFRRKLIRPGGFMATNIFVNRGSSCLSTAAELAYQDFCEAADTLMETNPEYSRLMVLAWNSLVGIRAYEPTSPKGHYVEATTPDWLGYKTHGNNGLMYTGITRVKAYPKKACKKGIKTDRKKWLRQGLYRIVDKV